MHKLADCVESRGKAVYRAGKTVFLLCNFIVQTHPFTNPMSTTRYFSATLCAIFSPNFPRIFLSFIRGWLELIPTIHSPNNKSNTDVLDFYLGKLWRGAHTA